MTSPYLRGYPDETVAQVQSLLLSGKLGNWLQQKYPDAHGKRDDRALFAYVQENKLQLVQNALGTHTNIARVQGAQLKAKREIRIASLFKDTPLEFLRMIAVHELAHLRERDHDKNFYKLCCYMEPEYHQLEFEVRVYLTYLEAQAQPLWS
jgi:hypothetical protein